MLDLVLLTQVFSTLAMVGLIWFVQVVHYPLFASVGREQFRNYEREHQDRTTRVVAPLMLAEATSTLWLAWQPPSGVSPIWTCLGLVLLSGIWASTFFWQVPCHGRLAEAFETSIHRSLVRSNWFRTAAWSGRGLLVCYFLIAGLRA